MDNFALNITAEGEPTLKLAFDAAFTHNAPGAKATHYSVREPQEGERQEKPDGVPKHWQAPWKYGQEPRPRRIVFFWHAPEQSQPDVVALPFSLDAAGAAEFAMRWLAEAPYGREPDHDGDNGRGWRAYVEGWGHVDGSHYAVIAVSPSWAQYGK